MSKGPTTLGNLFNNVGTSSTTLANAAFEALDPALLAFLQSPEGLETLQTVLLYHVLEDVYPSVNLPEGTTTVPTAADGQTVTVLRDDIIVFVNGVLVSIPDVLANNGIIRKSFFLCSNESM